MEQPRNEPKRIRYVPERDEFVRTEANSLIAVRGFGGAYGWIAGTGAPPDVHYDALLITDAEPLPGDVIEAVVSGMFLRGDGDHKFVTIDLGMSGLAKRPDLFGLPARLRDELRGLYPRVGTGEGWHGAGEARRHLIHEPPTHV